MSLPGFGDPVLQEGLIVKEYLRLVVHLGTLGNEEGDGGLGSREPGPVHWPSHDPQSLEREGWGCIFVVTGGDGVCEVVSI